MQNKNTISIIVLFSIFSHDGKTLASGAADGKVLLWNWEKVVSHVKEIYQNSR